MPPHASTLHFGVFDWAPLLFSWASRQGSPLRTTIFIYERYHGLVTHAASFSLPHLTRTRQDNMTTLQPEFYSTVRRRSIVEIDGPGGRRKTVDLTELSDADRQLAEEFGYKPVSTRPTNSSRPNKLLNGFDRYSRESSGTCRPSPSPSVSVDCSRRSPLHFRIPSTLEDRPPQYGAG